MVLQLTPVLSEPGLIQNTKGLKGGKQTWLHINNLAGGRGGGDWRIVQILSHTFIVIIMILRDSFSGLVVFLFLKARNLSCSHFHSLACSVDK